ncbi:hypothetical protein PIB30_088917 [Stylosanthes scabra]|uniref:PB1-like domain-containing protein n=1 Tax=Stylosanthes scabra TaxID=79078 RepID=A0ABU6RTT1_9FABA|nr:hypothetical protein [Stylosanthes scabra]
MLRCSSSIRRGCVFVLAACASLPVVTSSSSPTAGDRSRGGRRRRQFVAPFPSVVAAVPSVLMADSKHISLIIHHRGRFEHDSNGVFAYVDGETEIVDWVNVDKFSGKLIKDILSKIGYPNN